MTTHTGGPLDNANGLRNKVKPQMRISIGIHVGIVAVLMVSFLIYGVPATYIGDYPLSALCFSMIAITSVSQLVVGLRMGAKPSTGLLLFATGSAIMGFAGLRPTSIGAPGLGIVFLALALLAFLRDKKRGALRS